MPVRPRCSQVSMAFVSSFCPTARVASRGPLVCSSFRGVQVAKLRVVEIRKAQWSANISSNDFRPGTTIEVDGAIFRVSESLHVKPGKGAAFVRTKLKNMKTGGTVDRTFRAGENVASATLEKVKMQHTYLDGGDYVFMNMETYDEERMSAAVLGEKVVKFLLIGMEVEVLKHNEDILGIDLEKVITYTVVNTDPGVRGNTSQGGGLKPCTIDSGAQIMVPLFINEGEKIKVSTETGKYMSRDNE